MRDLANLVYNPQIKDLELAPMIKPIFRILRKNKVKAVQSCQGGKGHSYPVPTVDFFGTRAEGFRAAYLARTYGMPLE